MNQIALPFETSISYDEEFIEGQHNALALGWVKRWPQWSNGGLILCGERGSGKTHLAHQWAKISQAAFLEDIPTPENAPKHVVIENVDVFFGDESEEEKIFHLLNHLKQCAGSILLTTQKNPMQWFIKLPDLQSRMRALPAVDITFPDDDFLHILLAKYFANRQLIVGSDVLDYLCPRLERSFFGVQTLVQRIDEAALLSHRAVTLPLVRDVLQNSVLPNE